MAWREECSSPPQRPWSSDGGTSIQSRDAFDAIALAYDNSIDWDARLKREIPFVLRHLPKGRGARVLDLACGSGRHSVALASRGFEVVGLDSSHVMLSAAAELVRREGVSVRLIESRMEDLHSLRLGKFNLVLCLGNSLALLPDQYTLTEVLVAIEKSLAPGGTLLFQVLNFEEIRFSKFDSFPLKRGVTPTGEEVVFARFFDHSGSRGLSTLVFSAMRKTGDCWASEVRCQHVLNLDRGILERLLRQTGFKRISWTADYEGSVFEPQRSRDLVVVASRDE
ncbi:MAG: class I SAM-dependent methyltransferase [Candidatus Thorarchaeota archaeon]|nr:class I SAM-dependent methyltransferase [Candidatus Thorarchaeota archaeon]